MFLYVHVQVLLYATALREAIDERGFSAKRNGTLLVEKMWNRTIEGEEGISLGRLVGHEG